MCYSNDEKSVLLAIALNSIKSGLEHGKRTRLRIEHYSTRLTAQRASFVTLNHGENLRGCIGTLEARTTLVESIADNAYGAAFHDPRFPALTTSEVSGLDIHVSVLGPLTPVTVDSEEALLNEMIPGDAGWVLQENDSRGTFLPSVWSSLAEPVDFLQKLKMKAGLTPDYWSGSLKIWRYTTASFAASVADIARSGIDTSSAG